MKTVTSSNQVAHLWANRAQERATNSGRTFYFEGPTIYSYGRHFPIAAHVQNRSGAAAVLFTRQTRSVTTAGHCDLVRRALHGLGLAVFSAESLPSFAPTASDLKRMARAAVEQWRERLPQRLLDLSLRRAQWLRDSDLSRLRSECEELNQFAAFAGYRGRVAMPADLDGATAAAARRQQAAMRKRGEPWQPSGLKAEAFGGFPLRAIAADGAVQIGCHSIAWAEIERLAVSLGWCAPGCSGTCEPPCAGCA